MQSYPIDFTACTENDVAGNRITVNSASKVTVSGLVRTEKISLEKDFGLGNYANRKIKNRFIWDFDFKITTISAAGNHIIGPSIGDTSNSGYVDYDASSDQNGFFIYCNNPSNTTNVNAWIAQINNGAITTGGTIPIVVGTQYYARVTIEQSNSYGTLTFKFYSSAARTGTPVGTSSVALAKTFNLRHLFAVSSFHHASGTQTCSYVIENMVISFPEIVDDFEGVSLISSNTYFGAKGRSFQRNLNYNGAHWSYLFHDGNGTSNVAKMAAALRDQVFSISAVPDSLCTAARGYHMATATNPVLYKCQHVWTANNNKLASFFLSNYDPGVNYNAAFIYGAYAGSLAGQSMTADFGVPDYNNYGLFTDFNNQLWVSGHFSGATAFRAMQASSGLNNLDWNAYQAWTGYTSCFGTMVMIPGATNAADVGRIVADGNALDYCHWDHGTDTWGSPEAVTSTSASNQSFACSAAKDGKAVALWRDSTDQTLLKGRIRSAGSGGSWGTPFTVVSDLGYHSTLGVYSDFCSASNLGADSEILFGYYNSSGNIVKRSLNATSGAVGDADNLATSVGTFQSNPWMQCPDTVLDKFGITYQLASGGIYLASKNLTPQEEGTHGVLVSKTGFPGFATFNFIPQVVDQGDYSGLTHNGHDGTPSMSVYHNPSKAFVVQPTKVHFNPHWDAHNLAGDTISPTGYLALAMNGRIYGVGTFDLYDSLTVLKSLYPLDDPSFDKDNLLDNFIDISPDTLHTHGGRGYKYLQFDDNELLHLATCHENKMFMRNYNDADWTAYTAGIVFDFSSLGVGNNLYVDGMKLGKELSGQKSLWISFTKWDVAHYSTPNLSDKNFVVKVVPQAGRGYLMYDANDSAITMPITDAYTTGDAAPFNSADETSYATPLRQGFCILTGNIPFTARLIYNNSTGAFVVLRATYWNYTLSQWDTATITTTDPGLPGYPSARTVSAFEANGKIYVLWAALVSGIPQMMQSVSADGGATWSSPTQRTTDAGGFAQETVDSAILYQNIANSHIASEVRMLPKLVPRIPREAFANFY